MNKLEYARRSTNFVKKNNVNLGSIYMYLNGPLGQPNSFSFYLFSVIGFTQKLSTVKYTDTENIGLHKKQNGFGFMAQTRNNPVESTNIYVHRRDI